MEDTLVEFLERGATVESDILTNVKSALPPELAQQLQDLIPPLPNNNVPPTYDAQWNEQAQVEVPIAVYSADAVAESRIGV